MTEALQSAPAHRRSLDELLRDLAGLKRELVESARLCERKSAHSASLAYFSAAERLVEVLRADSPLPVPPKGEFSPEIADAFQSVLAAADTAIASHVSTGRVDGPSALRVFHTIRDAVADTDPGLAAHLSPRLTAMVTRE